METMECILRRKSCRKFKDEMLTGAEKEVLLKAANAAPIGMGRYEDVHISVIEDKNILEEWREKGAKLFGNPKMNPMYGAPCVFVVSTRKLNEDRKESQYMNAACVIENMLLAATDMNLGSVYLLGVIAAVKQDEAFCRKLGVDDGFEITAAVAIGKPEHEEWNLKKDLNKILVKNI